jgi:hypothetical protein
MGVPAAFQCFILLKPLLDCFWDEVFWYTSPGTAGSRMPPFDSFLVLFVHVGMSDVLAFANTWMRKFSLRKIFVRFSASFAADIERIQTNEWNQVRMLI